MSWAIFCFDLIEKTLKIVVFSRKSWKFWPRWIFRKIRGFFEFSGSKYINNDMSNILLWFLQLMQDTTFQIMKFIIWKSLTKTLGTMKKIVAITVCGSTRTSTSCSGIGLFMTSNGITTKLGSKDTTVTSNWTTNSSMKKLVHRSFSSWQLYILNQPEQLLPTPSRSWPSRELGWLYLSVGKKVSQ